jgi:hypothetical protein
VTDGHAGDALSALLDGELDPVEARAIRDHLAGCAACADELDGVRAVRAAVRGLPGLDPPGPLRPASGVVVPFRRRRGALASLAASAAAVAVLALATSGDGPTSTNPDPGGAVADHAASVVALFDQGRMSADGGLDPLAPERAVTPTTAAPRGVEGLPAPFRAPTRLSGGYLLVEAFRREQGLHLVYEHGQYALSVFQSVGDVDFDDLPDGGGSVDVAGSRGWRQDSAPAEGRVVVFELDGLAVLVAGDEPGDAVLEAARSLPGPRSLSLVQRLRRRCADVLDGLSPVG